MQTFLVLGAIFGFIGVALGAFGSHALRSKLTSERVATFETGVRYQMWHALALFVVVIVEAWTPSGGSPSFTLVGDRGGAPFLFAAGWLFAAGIVLFSGSLYALAVTHNRAWGAVTPFGGTCLLLGLGDAAVRDPREMSRATSAPLPSPAGWRR
jgi:uncharacterized membrane protein YgdD (TMEM256/DUF423 family)